MKFEELKNLPIEEQMKIMNDAVASGNRELINEFSQGARIEHAKEFIGAVKTMLTTGMLAFEIDVKVMVSIIRELADHLDQSGLKTRTNMPDVSSIFNNK